MSFPLHTITSHNDTYSLSSNTLLDSTPLDQEPPNISPNIESFNVCVRVRPLNPRELARKVPNKQQHIVKLQNNIVTIVDPDVGFENVYKRDKQYAFDSIFTEDHNTYTVFIQTMLPLLDNVLNGYNATMFAYGMTGAGKTHTLFGELDPETLNIKNPGLIFLTLEELFRKIQSPGNEEYEFNVKISYLEIYNEQVRDLLKGDDQNLMILEDPQRGVLVADLTETQVYTQNQVMHLIKTGNKKRTMASTAANTFSSRSHAIVQVVIERRQKAGEMKGMVLQAKLSLIDLAGSERAAVTENKGIRMLEGANINRSLLALGNCINILSDPTKKGAFVPYRDSKLTRLLKDSLGGNTKTIMIACISPSFGCFEETVNTLKYASRAKNIKRELHQNVKEVELHVSEYKEIIEALKSEIDTLKHQLHIKNYEDARMSKQIEPGMMKKVLVGLDNGNEKSRIEAEEKMIDEASHKIFENLEQNWEISQTLRELEDLEFQNKDMLENLYRQLETLSPENMMFKDQILIQIEELRTTMENNEKIRGELTNTLRGNLLENTNLKENLGEFASSVHTLEDIELAKKLLHIDKLDIMTQNTQIKKEALSLAKAKSTQNKQISQMEEEMRKMKSQLEEKEKMLATKNSLIQNLRHQITEQSSASLYSLGSPMAAGTARSIQFFDQTVLSPKQEKFQDKTSSLKSLLQNLQNKVAQSLQDLESNGISSSARQNTEDVEVQEALRVIESYTDRKYRSSNEFEHLKKIPTQHMKNSIENIPLSVSYTHPPVSVRSPNNKLAHVAKSGDLLDSRRETIFSNNILSESITSLPAQSFMKNSSTDLANKRSSGAHEKPPSSSATRSRGFVGHEAINNISNISSESRSKVMTKRISTGGILETSSRVVGDIEKLVDISDIEDIGHEMEENKTAGGCNTDRGFRADPHDFFMQSSHDKPPLTPISPFSKKEEPLVINVKLNTRVRNGGMILLDERLKSPNSAGRLSIEENIDWKTKRKDFKMMVKNKTREQSMGNIGGSMSNPRIAGLVSNKHSNSIVGLRCNFFNSVLGSESGFGFANDSMERRGMELKSLGQERENLKVFRSKLHKLIETGVQKLTPDLLEQIKELVEEHALKNYILSAKDQDSLKMLKDAVTQSFEPKKTQGRTGARSQQQQHEVQSAALRARDHNKMTSNERKCSQDGKHSRKNSLKGSSSQSSLILGSPVGGKYMQTGGSGNKGAGPGYTGKPEGKGKLMQMKVSVPLAKKILKENDGNAAEPRKFAVSILNILENHPKYISNAMKGKDVKRNASGERVKV